MRSHQQLEYFAKVTNISRVFLSIFLSFSFFLFLFRISRMGEPMMVIDLLLLSTYGILYSCTLPTWFLGCSQFKTSLDAHVLDQDYSYIFFSNPKCNTCIHWLVVLQSSGSGAWPVNAECHESNYHFQILGLITVLDAE